MSRVTVIVLALVGGVILFTACAVGAALLIAAGADKGQPAAVTAHRADPVEAKPQDTPRATPAAQPSPEPTSTPLPPDLQLKANLTNALGDSNRYDGDKLTDVQIIDDGAVIDVYWGVNDNLSDGWVKDGAKLDIVNILKTIRESSINYESVGVYGKFPLVDKLGNSSEGFVIKAKYNRVTVDKIKFDNLLAKNIYDIADEVWLHPAFQE